MTHISCNLKKKSDLTLIEINIICEITFYFINIIITNKILIIRRNGGNCLILFVCQFILINFVVVNS